MIRLSKGLCALVGHGRVTVVIRRILPYHLPVSTPFPTYGQQSRVIIASAVALRNWDCHRPLNPLLAVAQEGECAGFLFKPARVLPALGSLAACARAFHGDPLGG